MSRGKFNDLIEAARRGDVTALDRLLVVAQPDIRRNAWRTCMRASDVDDAVQDTMSLIARRVGTLRLAASFTAWMFAIVRRECLRMAKGRSLSREPIDELEERLQPVARSDSDLHLDLAGAIASLPEHYRRALILRDVEEFTIGEIAARTADARSGEGAFGARPCDGPRVSGGGKVIGACSPL